MSAVVVVESPAKCEKIKSFLGPGHTVLATCGHLRRLGSGLDCIDTEDGFRPTFEMIPGKGKYLKAIKRELAQVDKIILATDDDREGEAIAWHLCMLLGIHPEKTQRIVFHEITKQAVQRAIAHPRYVNLAKVEAQQTRQILDRLVGFMISPILWKHVSRNKQRGLSAGRCQTPALRLVSDNQIAIDRAPKHRLWQTIGLFTPISLHFRLQYSHTSEIKLLAFLEESKCFQHVYTPTPSHKVTQAPPKPFTTSRLQQKASNELHLSPPQTMKAAQKLYEEGYITYMRTDNQNYSEEFSETVARYIDSRWGQGYIGEIITQGQKRSKSRGSEKKEGAHEAIRPTLIERTDIPATLDSVVIRLYSLIWRNTVESCMSAAIYEEFAATLSAPQDLLYRAKLQKVVFMGWQALRGLSQSHIAYERTKLIESGTLFVYKSINSKFALKSGPLHLTEAKLVQSLEKKGIGRPSTYASLIDKIKQRGYVRKGNIAGKVLPGVDFLLEDNVVRRIEVSRKIGAEKNKLILTSVGRMVVQFLVERFQDLFQYDYTQKMELQLDDIEAGTLTRAVVCGQCHRQVADLCGQISPETKVNIPIDSQHTYIIGRYGPVIKCKTKGGSVSFKKVRPDIDIDRLQKGEYTLSDILQPPSGDRTLGTHKNKPVILKKGKYGPYITWNSGNYSLRNVKKNYNNIILEDIIGILLRPAKSSPAIYMSLGHGLSVREGRFGPYIHHHPPSADKPKFFGLRGIKWKKHTKRSLLAWVQNTYGLNCSRDDM